MKTRGMLSYLPQAYVLGRVYGGRHLFKLVCVCAKGTPHAKKKENEI